MTCNRIIIICVIIGLFLAVVYWRKCSFDCSEDSNNIPRHCSKWPTQYIPGKYRWVAIL